MKNLSEYLMESTNADVEKLAKKIYKVEKKAENAEKDAAEAEKDANKSEETIKDEKSFREAAKAKFEEVFGDDLDEKQMNKTIDGLLKDNKESVEKGDWGTLIGMLNKSFGK